MATAAPSELTILTDAKIRDLRRPKSGQIEVRDKSVPGLRVRIGTSGTKSFVLLKRVAGKSRNIAIGRFSERFGLAEARKKARQILSDIELKADPLAALPLPRRRSAASLTVNALWPEFKASKAHLRSIGEIERVFKRHILPEFGDRAADKITRSEITRLIDEIARSAPVMARNTLGYLSSFYGWAMPRLDHLQANPCRDAGRPRAPKPRERVLSEEEVGALWHVLEGEGKPFGPALKLLLLTGQRRNEVFDADRAEFDVRAKLWTISRERAKNGATHLVPLSSSALAIVKELLKDQRSEKLLPARGNWDMSPSGFSKAMRRIRESLEEEIGRPVPHWTLHDLRRTLATGLQRLGVRLEVTEAVLNHLSGSRSGIVGVYQRHNYFHEKKAALAAWEREVKRLARIHKGRMATAALAA
ncbi:MAG TPA: tyrosine-type recombinase/integrase [Allosphingosinicella sp.]|nr:tyrosine-type recombinase/integrase [Allosphingosinicella sp.]